MKCLMCGEETERNKFHFHLKKCHNKMKMKEYYIKFDFEFANKKTLEKMYYSGMSFKQITKEMEGKYNISNLKSIILEFANEFNINKRDISEANKNYFVDNDVWNKGLTKETNKSVRICSEKKIELYKKVKEKLKSLSIEELLNFNIQQNKKIRSILRSKLIEKQNNICPVCNSDFSNLNNSLKHIHHIDRDNINDIEENLIVLCASCHMKISGHKHRLKNLDFIKTYKDFMDNLFLIRKEISKIKKNRSKDFSYRDTKYGICEICGSNEHIHRHHLDINPNNNDESNLIFLCEVCHGKVTGFNIKANKKEDMMYQLHTINKFNRREYCNNIKENGKCSISISKLKLTEFIQ